MMNKFSQRSFEKELMDDLECSGDEAGTNTQRTKTIK